MATPATAAAGASSGVTAMEGFLNKKGRIAWKKRWFVLQGNALAYFAKKGDAKFRNQMLLGAESTVTDSSSKKNGFAVVTTGKGFQLNAESPEDKAAWKAAIAAAIQLEKHAAGGGAGAGGAGSSGVAASASGRGLSASRHGQAGGQRKDTRTFYVVGTEFVLDVRYELIKPIGHGAYGVVISATDSGMAATQQKVAIKKCPNAFEDLVDAKRIVREIRLLMHFRHENIVRVLDIQSPAVADFDDVYIVSELMDTDLHRVIYSRQKLTDDHVQFFLYQMLCALKYMHSAKVIHRDLKPSNILLNSNCDLKICDFGLSRGVTVPGEHENNDLTEYVVTRWYRAPEIMLSCPEYTTAIDVWSVGCIFGEMLGRKPLFPGNDYIHQLKLITKLVGTPSGDELAFVTNHKARRFMLNLPREAQGNLLANLRARYPDASQEALDLLSRMLVIDPGKRITVGEALESPYLASLHDPAVEITADAPVNWGDIETCALDRQNLQRQILEDICRFHPECRDFLRDRRTVCGMPDDGAPIPPVPGPSAVQAAGWTAPPDPAAAGAAPRAAGGAGKAEEKGAVSGGKTAPGGGGGGGGSSSAAIADTVPVPKRRSSSAGGGLGGEAAAAPAPAPGAGPPGARSVSNGRGPGGPEGPEGPELDLDPDMPPLVPIDDGGAAAEAGDGGRR